jgi:hypothetical protein
VNIKLAENETETCAHKNQVNLSHYKRNHWLQWKLDLSASEG